MDTILAFDIETIPDTATGGRLLGVEDLEDGEIAQAMFHLRNQKSGTEFLQRHLHRVASIGVALRTRDDFQLWSLGSEDCDEAELISRFFEGIERYSPVLVTWNGSGFDLPVLHYRALLHGIRAPRYWETGREDSSFRYNNYLSRYHWRHVDLMDVLSGLERGARAPLEEIAVMLGLPGKMGMHGSLVWSAWQAGEIARIRAYCETDTLNTYLIYQRFELMRGSLSEAGYHEECGRVRAFLEAAEAPHLREYLRLWLESTDKPSPG